MPCNRTNCIYHARPSSPNNCDYNLVTKQPRGCPAGAGCTRYQSTGTLNKKCCIDWGVFPALYEAGLHDAEIAAEMHCSRYTIASYRRNKGLVANPKRGGNTDGNT